MTYTFSRIAQLLSSNYILHKDYTIRFLAIDSRLVFSIDNTLFFAIKGNFNDGHSYIQQLYNRGVRNFCVNNYFNLFDQFPEANFIIVDNTIKALQNLGQHHRSLFKIPTIAITGSNGKTIVKEWLRHFLSKQYKVVCSPKSYNSQIGVPLSVWEMDNSHQIAVFEAGISHPNEMINLEKILKPTIGIFTNIGDAHQENFSDYNHKIAEKLILFKDVQTIIYSPDFQLLHQQIIQNYSNKKIFTWSLRQEADIKLLDIISDSYPQQLKILYANKTYLLKTKLTDKASIENTLSVLCALLVINPNSTPEDYNLLELSPVEMRLQQIQGINNCTIINDSYNSDLTSLRVAIEVLLSLQQHKKRTLIISDILQQSRNTAELYYEIASIIKSSEINQIFAIGENFFANRHFFDNNCHFYKNTTDFLTDINKFDFHNNAILIKGARSFGFERITERLQYKNHNTILEISIPALEHNLAYFRNLLQPSTRLMVMVKAFSYGSGTYEIANWLQRKNIDYIAVAIADEGFELRNAGITIPIMVLNPDSSNFSSYTDFNLEPEIYNFRILNQFYDAIKNNITNPYPIHIKINTGMNRLGFNLDQIDQLIELLQQMDKIYVKSVFSHLAASGEPEFDNFTQSQFDKFILACEKIQKKLGYRFLKHILNSGGIERFPQFQLDMVRLGIGLYGISQNNANLRNISTLKTKIIHIQRLTKDDTVGYSRRGKLTRDSTIATIPVGYADGLNRLLSNGNGFVVVNNHKAPIVGNICMDLTMIDITDIDAQEGDEVIIFGDQLPITLLAEKLNTIPYEILTSISPRVKRIYIWE